MNELRWLLAHVPYALLAGFLTLLTAMALRRWIDPKRVKNPYPPDPKYFKPPHIQEEEAAGWMLACEFTPEEGPEAIARVCKLPLPGNPVFRKPRSWIDRLFTRPWRPWCNVRVWIATGPVATADFDRTAQRTTISAMGSGRITESTARG